jgi:hypothetical protein
VKSFRPAQGRCELRKLTIYEVGSHSPEATKRIMVLLLLYRRYRQELGPPDQSSEQVQKESCLLSRKYGNSPLAPQIDSKKSESMRLTS